MNLISICNQKSIYEFLFRERMNGQPHGRENALSFFTWANSGWKEQSHFVFSLVAPTGLIAGVLDIKTADRSMAEIGYWCSEEHRGLMSGAVSELKSLAMEAGFEALFARVRTDNVASRRVLENNGFASRGEKLKEPGRLRYEVLLSR